MKKNAFLTFIFACIPGAGQMYYGYMKRGLSMITFFCLFIMAGTLVDVLVVGSVIEDVIVFLIPMTSSVIWRQGNL